MADETLILAVADYGEDKILRAFVEYIDDGQSSLEREMYCYER